MKRWLWLLLTAPALASGDATMLTVLVRETPIRKAPQFYSPAVATARLAARRARQRVRQIPKLRPAQHRDVHGDQPVVPELGLGLLITWQAREGAGPGAREAAHGRATERAAEEG